MLKLENVCKTYRTSGGRNPALDEISLTIARRRVRRGHGAVGCGKSTLLNMLGLLDSPTSGAYDFFGEEVAGSEKRN